MKYYNSVEDAIKAMPDCVAIQVSLNGCDGEWDYVPLLHIADAEVLPDWARASIIMM